MLKNFAYPESLLHYIWQHRAYKQVRLRTTDGEAVQVLYPGRLNHNQGPDFHQAQVRIEDILWQGQVEIHAHTRNWYEHHHEKDKHYDTTILHVVYESEGDLVRRADGTSIPELELKPYISPSLLRHYDKLRLSQDKIPCGRHIEHVSEILSQQWLSRLGISRIQNRANEITIRLKSRSLDWEQIIWEELAWMMGGPVNQDAFRQLAERLAYKILRKYLHKSISREALLMGMCGLLQTQHPTGDPYYQALREQWLFLSHKYKLSPIPVAIQFHRLRPPAFPNLRLSQLGVCISKLGQMGDLLSRDFLAKWLEEPVFATEYWDTHYRFGEVKKTKKKSLGIRQKEIMAINSILPLAWVYQQNHQHDTDLSWIIDILEKLKPENNRITRVFTDLGISNRDALHSQGMIELKKSYCDTKSCLSCQIGKHILKRVGD